MHFISIKVHKQVKRKPRFSGFPEVCGEVEYPLSNCKTNGLEKSYWTYSNTFCGTAKILVYFIEGPMQKVHTNKLLVRKGIPYRLSVVYPLKNSFSSLHVCDRKNEQVFHL